MRPGLTLALSTLGCLLLVSPGARGAAGLPIGTVRVAALKMDSDNTALNRRTLLQAKLAALKAGVGAANLDLVVVGEYTFFAGYEADGVRIQPDGNGFFTLLSAGTAKSNEIVAAVDETRSWAVTNNINVCLGTLAEAARRVDDPELPCDVVFNTMLIIDRQGRIAGRKRKMKDFLPSQYQIHPLLRRKALETVATFPLTTQGGLPFTIFPIICAERSDVEMLDYARNFNADLLVESEREGDCPYEDITVGIQNSAWSPEMWGWPGLIREMLIREYVDRRDILKPGGWFAVSESAGIMGGIMQLNEPPLPLAALSRTADYVYGVIAFQGPAAPVVTMAASDASAAETATDGGAFTVSRTGSLAAPLTVQYALSGTATNGIDYAGLSGTLTIGAGSGSAIVPLSPVVDALAEGAETATLTLSSSPDYLLGSILNDSVTIYDAGILPTVEVKTPQAYASEEGPLAALCQVTRTGSQAAALTVPYTLSGTATNGSDYGLLSGSVTIPPGSGAATITLVPTDDTIYEGNEQVTLTLANNAGYALGTYKSAWLLIQDNDQPRVTVHATDAVASEAGPDTGTFTVSRTGSTAAALTVRYTVAGTATNGSDYANLAGSVTIGSGSATATVSLTPVDDGANEGSEHAILQLYPEATSIYIVGSPGVASVALADNDLPVVTVTAADASASETGPDTGTFTVSRTGSTAAALTVLYSLSGSATNGTDYSNLGGSVTIGAGASSATVTVVPIDDPASEGAETVVLALAANAAYGIGAPANATVNLADNDLPVVTVTATDASASETGPDTGTFTVSRTGSTAAALTVLYSLSGSATNGTDYSNLGGSVTIGAGASSTTVTVVPIDDPASEGAETVVLALTANAAYGIGAPANATVNLADNDPAMIAVTVSSSPPGRVAWVEGISYSLPQTFSWAPASTHGLSADSPQAGAAGVRYVFEGWSNGGAQSHAYVTPGAGATVTVAFVTQYEFTTKASPAGGGAVQPLNGSWHISGTSLFCLATPNSGFNFIGWAGDLGGPANPQPCLLAGPRSVTALFNTWPTLGSGPTAAPNPARVGEEVAFQAGGYDADGDPLGYAWDFGDGTSSSGSSLVHAYTAPGTYTARLTLSDGRGGMASASTTVKVSGTVVLQDGLGGLLGTEDLFLNKSAPKRNYGAVAALQSRRDTSGLLASAPLVRFAIFRSEGGPVPDGATILSATLSLYKYTRGSHGLEARRVLRVWEETESSWLWARTGQAWAAPGAQGSGSDIAGEPDGTGRLGSAVGWLSVPVTAGVQAMASGASNRGWSLLGAGATGLTAKFYSREYPSKPQLRPKLTIDFVP